MQPKPFYHFLHKQIRVMLALSLGPGLGYIFLGSVHGAMAEALVWYALLLVVSAWGYRLHRRFDYRVMTREGLRAWYRQLTWFFYSIFALWTLVFVLFGTHVESGLHYVAIFTQIGASVVAATLLFSDRRLFLPVIAILVVPLIAYFSQIEGWLGVVMTLFGGVFLWVLVYASNSSNQLLQMTHFQASRDQLTGLYNRSHFNDVMEQTVNSLRTSRGYCCLLLVDLDHFKTINDSLGHDVGDQLLKEVAARMRRLVGKEAMVARMGGDEFIVVGPVGADRDACTAGALRLAEQLRDALKSTYEVDRHHLYISASIGVSVIHDPRDSAARYIKEADIAMYEVKDRGRDGVVLFNDEVSRRVERNLQIERLLHFALARRELALHYQPQTDRDRRIVGCEALLRWHCGELGPVSPGEFIPVAEKTGLIVEIGHFVIEEAFRTLADWSARGIHLEQFSINLSVRQFFHDGFVRELAELRERYLRPEFPRVMFELTESTMAEELSTLVDKMQRLKALGFGFSIDDFGTGYSSLSYLRRVPLDEIKIDRSFISELTANRDDQAMVETIFSLARVYGLKVVAEGVETTQQEDFLVARNCDLLQGYLFSRPLSREEFEVFHRSWKPGRH